MPRDRSRQRALHDLRHFAATRLLTAGIDLRTVAGRLGHSKASTTLNVYASFVPDADRLAAETMSQLLAQPAPGDRSRDNPGRVSAHRRQGAAAGAARDRPAEVLATTEARARLCQIAADFERRGTSAAPIAFGNHRRPQGVIVPWDLWLEITAIVETGS